MAKASERAPVLGPAFIRLLARFNAEGASPAAPAVPERLAQWFDWNRAITLSKALDNPPPAQTHYPMTVPGDTGERTHAP